MNPSPEEQEVGKVNFQAVIGSRQVRREFLMGGVKKGVAPLKGLGAMYYGYDDKMSEPVRVGVLGTGDEGNVLLGAINPAYVTVVSIADVRPYNQYRAFYGDYDSPSALKARPGLNKVYKKHPDVLKNIKHYQAYQELLANAEEGQGRGGDHRLALAPARAGGDRRDEGGVARADRETHGPQRPRVQGNGPGLGADEALPGHRAPAALQHPLRQRDGGDQEGAVGRLALHPRPVAPRQPARRRQLATADAQGGQAHGRAGGPPARRLGEARNEASTARRRPQRSRSPGETDRPEGGPDQGRGAQGHGREVRLQRREDQGRQGQGGLRASGRRGTDPLAVVGTDRRRPDGRTGQPPARRGQPLHLGHARRQQADAA